MLGLQDRSTLVEGLADLEAGLKDEVSDPKGADAQRAGHVS